VVRDGQTKFVDAPRPELYDLDADPFEERNQYTAGSAMARVMARRLDVLAELWRTPGSPIETVPADVRARLAALGYVGRGARGSGASGLDPKDYIQTFNAVRSARRSFN